MKVGVIARVDDRGLGNQTWEVARHLNPERVLVLTVPSSERQGFHPHYDRFPDATVMTVDDRLPTWQLKESAVKDWLSGLDVVYTAETAYDDSLPLWAAQLGVATVIHCNPEWYRHHRGGIPHPTVWWSATTWRLDFLPDSTRVVPMPVPTDRWPAQCDSTERAVIHPAGRVAAGDRNGTLLAIEAARYMPDVTVYVTHQEGLRDIDPPGNVDVAGPTPNYWDTYRAPVMLLPRRYGGLCLPAIEACGAGVVPVMPDVTPNRMWPGPRVKAHRQDERMRSQGGDLILWQTDPMDLATAVEDTLNNIDRHRADVAEWVASNSWDALRPMWEEELGRAVDAAKKPASRPAPNPRPSAPVSVLVPYTRDRADLWSWVKARWEAQHPTWEIVDVLWDHGEWCKAAALDQAVQWASADVLFVADADSYLAPEVAVWAAEAAPSHGWVVPHKDVYRLDRVTTERIVDGPADAHIEHRNLGVMQNPYIGVPGGGFVVLTREAWQECPMDRRFIGYGFEDYAWGEALQTLIGPVHRIGGDLVHLWHAPLNDRRKSDTSSELRQRYHRAFGVERLMRALVHGGEPVPPEPSGVVRFRSQWCGLQVRIGHHRVRFVDGLYETTDPDLAGALRMIEGVEEVR